MKHVVYNLQENAPMRFDQFGYATRPATRADDATWFRTAEAAQHVAAFNQNGDLQVMSMGECKLRMAGMSFL